MYRQNSILAKLLAKQQWTQTDIECMKGPTGDYFTALNNTIYSSTTIHYKLRTGGRCNLIVGCNILHCTK